MKISPARTAAFDVLKKIETEKAFSSVLLPIYEERLSTVDRGLCHELVLGVLRRQMWLDRAIDEFVGAKKLDLEVRIALRLGLLQLLFLDKVPAHAAVNESVELVVRAKKTSAKALVNAILRRATKETPRVEFADEIERISIETSHPRWLIEKWIGEYGIVSAEQLASANNVPPPLAFRRTLKGRDIDLTEYRASKLVDGCCFADSFESKLRQQVEAGEIYFQDEASQMVAAVVEVPPNGTLLDVCAAPGGKTGAVLLKNADAVVIAGDIHAARVAFLKQNLAKQGVRPQNVVQYNAELALPFADEAFDAVLVDAPCSGTGTIRHNPEIRYYLDSKDFAELQKTQLAILKNASKVVKPGGLLVYSTCSLEREENETVCELFVAECREFKPTAPGVPKQFITTENTARTLPHRDGMDGFFIAAFRRL
jgi:16S rRNA (cytosine967-C5)-methyltransferase